MAIPSIGTLGDLNQSFGQAMRQGDLAMASQQYLGESMVRSGQIIGSKIAETMAAREAESVAPFLQQSYMQAFDDIAGGNISLGLGKTIALSAQFGKNPILSRISNEAVQAAGLLTNAVYAQQRTETMVGSRPAPGQAGFDRELRKLDAEEAQLNAALNTNAPEETKDMWRKSLEQTRARRAQLVGEYGAAQGDADYVGTGSVGAPMPSGSDSQDQVEGIKSGWPTMSEADRADATKFLKDRWNITVTGTDANGLPIFADQNPQPTGDPVFDATPAVGQGVAPQTQKPQQQAPATIEQAMFGTDQAVNLFGGNVLFAQDARDKLKLDNISYAEDGSMRMSYNSEEGPQQIDLSKEEMAPFEEFKKNAPLVNADITRAIQNLGGIGSLDNISFKTVSAKSNGQPGEYEMQFNVKAVTPDGKKVSMQDIDFVRYNANGEPEKVLIDDEQKARIESLESAASLIRGTLKKKGRAFAIEEKAVPIEVAERAFIPANLPYDLNEETVLKGLGLDTEKMTQDTRDRFRVQTYALMDEVFPSKLAGLEETKRPDAFKEELKKRIVADATKKGAPFYGFAAEEKKPEKATKFDEDIEATLKEGSPTEILKIIADWAGEATSAIGRSLASELINRDADSMRRRIEIHQKLSKDQKRRAIEQVEAGRKKRLESL